MKKILSVILIVVIFTTGLIIPTFAFEEEIVYSENEVVTMYEDSVFITATGGKIDVFYSLLDVNFNNGEYVEDNILINGNNSVYERFSLVHLIENNALTISKFSYEFNLETELNKFSFVCVNEKGLVYEIDANTDLHGYILFYRISIVSQENDGTPLYTRCDNLNYLENKVYFTTGNGSFDLTFGDFAFVEFIKTPGAEYYIEQSKENVIYCEVDEYDILYITARREGNVEIYIKDADTGEILKTIYVNVEFNFFHWILYYICFGWLWM